MKAIHCVPGSESKLTIETKNGDRITAVMCDIEGNPLGSDKLHQARSTFFDSVTGERYIRLTEEEKNEYLENGDEVFHGVGEISGFFAIAPDYTINGVYGEKSGDAAAESSETQSHRPAKKAAKKSSRG